jgi:hypothetical protein
VTAVGSFDVSATDQRIQPNTGRPNNGTRMKISPSGVYVSSISSENQAAADAQIYNRISGHGGRKIRCTTSCYSQLTPEQGETHLQTSREYKRRRKSQGVSSNGLHHTPDGVFISNERITGRTPVKLQDYTNLEHEDLIYVPRDSFPVII